MTSERHRRAYAERVPGPDGRPVHPRAPHGTTGGYGNYGCRCPACTACNRAETRRRRGDRVRLLRWVELLGDWVTCAPVRHGLASTYQNWLCRCPACRAAASRARSDVPSRRIRGGRR